jgi:hypothetical protein
MTSEGWKRLEHLEENNTLIGISLEPKSVSTFVKNFAVLNNETFIKNCINAGIVKNQAEKYVRECKKLLPLQSTSKYMHIISRIFGFLLTDAWIGISENPRLSADFGSEYSLELFEKDIEYLGFQSKKGKYTEKEGYGSTYRVEHSGALPALFISLGISFGKKSTKEACKIPFWIMNGSDMIKREFLAGFQGGDGSKIKWGSDKQINVQIAKTSKTIHPEYLESLINMMSDIVKLFRDLEIIVDDVKHRPSPECENRMEVSYYISSSRENLINYFDIINYRYDVLKQVESGKMVEYLKYLDHEHKNRIELVNKIKNYGSLERIKIAENLNIPLKLVFNILKLNGKDIGLPKGLLKVKEWNNMIKAKNTTIFIPIRSITKSDENIISDITVDSDNQSFLCGDTFCVHNSPRNLYQSSMAKQAIGMFSQAHKIRTDTITHVLDYPQKPLVNTTPADFLGFNDMPAGVNVVVAIACYGGFKW